MVAISKAFVAFVVLLNFGYYSTEAKMLAMRPLSARQVYRLLQESGRSDAIPQGRVITQGLAAMTGFALGLTKGLGGALLFDIITANVTAADLESAVNGGSNSGNGALTTQEVCFNSRSARSLEEAEAVAEAYSRDNDSKKDKSKVRLSEVERRMTRKRRDKRRKKSTKGRGKRPSRLVLGKQTTGTATGGGGGDVTTGTGTVTSNPTTVVTTAPGTTATTATSPTAGATGTGTNVDNGEGTGTTSTSTTSTGNEGAINCVVIQKPAVG